MNKTVFLLSILVLCMSNSSCQVKDIHEEEHDLFVQEQNDLFKDSTESPLSEEARKEFSYINYYPYNAAYRVEARWVLTPDTEPFAMPTTTDRAPIYRKYGEVHFELDGRELLLEAYRSLELMKVEGFEEHLFIPFNDLTNGVTSYGGGRYVDFTIPDSETVYIDFNNSYHPYCAYAPQYSCPIPPDVNFMDVEIEAGVMSGLNGEEPDPESEH